MDFFFLLLLLLINIALTYSTLNSRLFFLLVVIYSLFCWQMWLVLDFKIIDCDEWKKTKIKPRIENVKSKNDKI